MGEYFGLHDSRVSRILTGKERAKDKAAPSRMRVNLTNDGYDLNFHVHIQWQARYLYG